MLRQHFPTVLDTSSGFVTCSDYPIKSGGWSEPLRCAGLLERGGSSMRQTCYRFRFLSRRAMAEHAYWGRMEQSLAQVLRGTGFTGSRSMHSFHQPSQMVITAMLLPGNRSDQVAARGLARPVSGGSLLADEGYRGADLFDWLYEEAQVLRAGALERP